MDFFLYILLGAGVGFAVGLTGVGGGSLMTPVLVFSGVPIKIAIGTDLLYAAVTKAVGSASHNRLGTIRWRLVFLLALGSTPGAILTAFLLRDVFNGPVDYTPVLNLALGLMLILTSLILLLKRYASNFGFSITAGSNWLQQKAPVITVLAGFVLGVLVTLSSVGAGALCAALLLMLYPRIPVLHIVGTDITHAVALTLIAGLAHVLVLQSVDWKILCGLLLGSLPAVFLGAKASIKIANESLQAILGVLLFVIGLKFILF